MVTTVAKPFVAPEPDGVAEKPWISTNGHANGATNGTNKDTAAIGRRKTCPRCSAHLQLSYYEPECLQCGYVDYTYSPTNGAKKSLISSGTRYVLRYVGEFSALSKTVTHIKLHRVRNRVEYWVNCPFCDNSMEQTSLSGKRREVREERYKCTEGHRVSLTPVRNGGLGWK